MNGDTGIRVIAESGQWHEFLESTAAALQLNLVFINTDNNNSLSYNMTCPVCKAELPFHRSAIPSDISDIAEPIYITDSDINHSVFSLDTGAYIIAQRCRRCRRDGVLQFQDSVEAANDLIRCVYKAMRNGPGYENVLSSVHRTVRLVLTKCRGGGDVLNLALNLILSVSVILFKASGGWIEYAIEKKSGLVTKGDCDGLSSIWSLKDRNFITANIMSSGISGKLVINAPAESGLSDRILEQTVQECGAAIEINHLMETTESKFDLVIESVESSIIVVDKYMSIVYVNRAAGKILGLSAAGWASLSVIDIEAPWLGCILSKTEKPIKGIKDKLSGRFVNWSVYPIREKSEIYGWLIIADDCTDDSRIRELEKNAENTADSEILYSLLAHEIKNPLATFRGLFQLIRLNKLSDDIIKYIDLGIKEVDRVSRLINEFTLLRKPLEYSSGFIDMRGFLDEIMPILNGEIIGRYTKIITDFDSVYPIQADPEQLTQVMLNLVRNAFEAIDENGSIFISLRSIKHDWVEITVRDTGPGIADETEDKIFEPFFSTKDGGTGLGLSICKSFVQNHGGGITVKNHPDGGAVFSVLLPTGHYMEDRYKKLDVLLVADDETLLDTIEKALKTEDLSILSVNNIGNAVFFMDKYIISVVVIDNAVLNTKDGAKIKHNHENILLLVSDNERVIKELNKAVCIQKPLNYAMFVNTVCELI